MASSKNTITVCEFDYICSENKVPSSLQGSVYGVPSDAFANLESFVLANDSDGEGASQFMRITQKRGAKMIQAHNYVGVLTTRDGTTIQILPKINKSDLGSDSSSKSTQELFFEMLRCLRKAPWKNMGNAPLRTERMPLYEIFIRMFVEEVEQVALRGFRAGYVLQEGNMHAVKGKIIFSNHLQKNCIDQSRIYVRYSSYELNRPENRLIKSALELLRHRTINSENRRRIQRLCDLLSDVRPSLNHAQDFLLTSHTRDNAYYAQALEWAGVFLEEKTFSAFRGDTISKALLFPMERLFEDYIASLSRRALRDLQSRGQCAGWRIETQKARWYLFEGQGVHLKPDIVLYNSMNEAVFAFDTKWKMLPDKNARPSNADQYQMFAYGHRLQTKHVVLLYPQGLSLAPSSHNWSNWAYHSIDKEEARFDVRSYFVNLSKAQESVTKLLEDLVELEKSEQWD